MTRSTIQQPTTLTILSDSQMQHVRGGAFEGNFLAAPYATVEGDVMTSPVGAFEGNFATDPYSAFEGNF